MLFGQHAQDFSASPPFWKQTATVTACCVHSAMTRARRWFERTCTDTEATADICIFTPTEVVMS